MEPQSITEFTMNRLGVKMKADATWLNAIRCFNHNFELAVKLSLKKFIACYSNYIIFIVKPQNV